MDTVFDAGHRRRPARSAIEPTAVAYGPGVSDMKARPARRALRASARSRDVPAAAAVRAARRSSPTPTRRSARRARRRTSREAAARRRRLPRPRVRPRERRHRLVAEGHPRRPDHRPRARGPRRRRAREGPQRDPRGGRPRPRLHALNGRWQGVTVNVGVIARRHAAERRGRAMRARGRRPGRAGEPTSRPPRRQIRAIVAALTVPDTTAEVDEMARWWPMEKLERSGPAGRARRRRSPAASGSSCRDAATGGASDANTTAGMGVPTLDGLGPDRRQRPRARRVPRGRLDRAPDDARRGAAAGDRARPAVVLGWRRSAVA